MVVSSESSHLEEQEVELEEGNDDDQNQAPAHNPSPPSDELFDITTTVDPCFLISLIRKLIPPDTRNNNDQGDISINNDFTEELKTAVMEECAIYTSIDAMDTIDDFDKHGNKENEYEESTHRGDNHTVLIGEDAWEENGCILWDLSTSKTHAELMVENLILEVLSANLMVSQSSRINEISIGIIGNLACHEVPRKQIVATKGLVEIIVEQLFIDDIPCLCETCRLLTLSLQGRECITWANALQVENVISRILWIAENALNPQLIEKSIGLLLAVLESEEELRLILLPPLMKLGLASLLINLLAFEMNKLINERISERYSVLDIILRAIEALSVIDYYSQELCLNKELFELIYDFIKLPDKSEVASSCVTAAVLFANILTDAADLVSGISHDLQFLQGLFDIFPFASDDLDALNAIWSIIAKLLIRVQESEMSRSSLDQYVSVLVINTDLIKDDLLDHQFVNEHESSTSPSFKENARAMLRSIVNILNHWISSKDCVAQNDNVEENYSTKENVERLLLCCRKYLR